MKNKILLLTILGLPFILFSGCSAKGKTFHDFNVVKGKSTVYFYRPDSFLNITRTTAVFFSSHLQHALVPSSLRWNV